jgi:DNA mismatch repair protein MutS2
VPVISNLFVDVGDDQSIENDLSTFSSRLQWMRETLKNLKQGALVLIDEAGSGTDPEEGGALFQAFIESVVEKGARTIITTHHGSLKVFAHEYEKSDPNLPL